MLMFTAPSLIIHYYYYHLICYYALSCSHLSTVLGNKFDHGAEAIVPVLFNLIPNCAKVMATSGVSAIRIIIRVSVADLWFLLIVLAETLRGPFTSRRLFIFSPLHPDLSAAHPRSPTHPPDHQ